MQYDFNEIINRRGSGSVKWDVKEQELPLWVADMDFRTAPAITKAIEDKAALGTYGYEIVPDVWYQAYQGWWKKHHNWSIEKEWLIFCTGVIPAISCAVKAMTNVGDNVLVQTPVYHTFFNSIENHGRHVVENKLHYEKGSYKIDWQDLEQKLSHPLTTLMILCNPHNPTGNLWTKEELAQIGELCQKHHVVVLSDEIHCDLVHPGYRYVPFASVSDCCRENSIICVAPSKTFNMAGLQSAAVVIPNAAIRNRMNRQLNSDEVAEPNTFAVAATVAAFTKGEEWLEQLNLYIDDNRSYVEDYLKEFLPKIVLVPGQAMYLLWLDCYHLGGNSHELSQFIREQTGLYLSDGSEFRGDGNGFMRMNIACPRSILEDAMKRLQTGVEQYEAQLRKGC